MLKDIHKQGDWLAKIDLKDAYFMIPVHHQDRKFLRFQNQGKTYLFKCLPFGLSSALWVFTKTLHPVVTLLRELGLRMVVYIDVILVMAESKAQIKDFVQCLAYLLENLDYIINYKKSAISIQQPQRPFLQCPCLQMVAEGPQQSPRSGKSGL